MVSPTSVYLPVACCTWVASATGHIRGSRALWPRGSLDTNECARELVRPHLVRRAGRHEGGGSHRAGNNVAAVSVRARARLVLLLCHKGGTTKKSRAWQPPQLADATWRWRGREPGSARVKRVETALGRGEPGRGVRQGASGRGVRQGPGRRGGGRTGAGRTAEARRSPGHTSAPAMGGGGGGGGAVPRPPARGGPCCHCQCLPPPPPRNPVPTAASG